MKCGLLGAKLGHSYSPLIHSQLADYTYDLFEKAPEELEDFLVHGDFTGLNVTIPYKKAVIPFCSQLSPRAEALGAVNTIVRRSDGSLIGHNTDYFGFHSMVQRSGLQIHGKKVLVLGSGGASATATAVLRELGANVVVVSRSGENNYENLHIHKDASVIVNTTPVGMYPNVNISPVDLKQFPTLEGVLDVVYNPARTKLIMDAEELGITAVNGLWMLVSQAKESAEWFTSSTIDNQVIEKIHSNLRRQAENIVLVGMPGCGKSTVGKALSKLCGKRLVDADSEIALYAGMSIPEIFSSKGEIGFRAMETEVLKNLGKESGLIIATGGGCVTRAENYHHLHQNGTIYWLQRSIDLLPTDGRPLSQQNKLQDLWQIRQPLYAQFADCSIDNNGSIEETAAKIMELEACK